MLFPTAGPAKVENVIHESYSGRKGQAEEEEQRGECVWKCHASLVWQKKREGCITSRNFPGALI